MRVSERGAAQRSEPLGGRRRAFADALERARGARLGTERPAGNALPLRSMAGRRAVAEQKDGVLRGRRGGFRADEEVVLRPDAADRARLEPSPAAVSSPELRALLRAVPVAIEAVRVRDGAPLELAFGRALSVELRLGRAGVELLLRPDATARASAVRELPVLVHALAARGVRVSRAEIDSRGAGSSPAALRAGARPDARIERARASFVDAVPGLR